jgi:hypothetical protein
METDQEMEKESDGARGMKFEFRSMERKIEYVSRKCSI